LVVSNVEKTPSVVLELPLVPVVLMECFLPPVLRQKMTATLVNIALNILIKSFICLIHYFFTHQNKTDLLSWRKEEIKKEKKKKKNC
jgi:hypothetical protein